MGRPLLPNSLCCVATGSSQANSIIARVRTGNDDFLRRSYLTIMPTYAHHLFNERKRLTAKSLRKMRKLEFENLEKLQSELLKLALGVE